MDISPLARPKSFTAQVSEEIASYGYPHGSTLLEKEDKVYRWGPLLQRGWIAGIAPFETAAAQEELLLDLSGAPIFRPSDGTVVAMLHSGKPIDDDMESPLTTTVFA